MFELWNITSASLRQYIYIIIKTNSKSSKHIKIVGPFLIMCLD